MEQFSHLRFIQKVEGKPRYLGGPNYNEQTEENRNDRKGHSKRLQSSLSRINESWHKDFNERITQNLALIEENVQPIFIQVNPDIINAEFNLESFGIEIISEEDDGYIIGASLDNFRTLENKVKEFVNSTHGTGKIADFWQIFKGNREVWKPQHILSEELYAKWNSIQDNKEYHLEVSIAFNKPLGKAPNPKSKGYKKRLQNYNLKVAERDLSMWERQSDFEDFITHYGNITSDIVELEDSFGCEVKISGKGLKDLVINYQFVFEVVEVENISGILGGDNSLRDIDIELVPPKDDAIEIGVIDSGIMESNKYLSPAIKSQNSRSYVPNDPSTADHVQRGGHGTKVAGALLFPKGLSNISIPHQLPFFLRNLRVLDSNCKLTHRFPAKLIEQIVEDNLECKLFNLSINSDVPFRNRHMSIWAAVIDNLIHEKDVLFIISSGNISFNEIKNYLRNNETYPDYLINPNCRIANPGHSSFGITVGSLNHNTFDDGTWKSLGNVEEISAYSRIGTGIWGHIKPDVVEFGGGIVYTNNGIITVKEHFETATELIRSTLHGGNAYGKDSVGTSFAAPKVTYIAAKLKELYPENGVNLIRALIAQGARPPGEYFLSPTMLSIMQFGYGIPLLERVTKNTEHRITFYNSGDIQADEGHLYSLAIPDELRSQGDEYEVLIEVTLAYSAKIRRTRQRTKSYLSTWLDWTTSKIGETFEEFKDYALKEIEGNERSYNKEKRKDLNNFDWKIKNRRDYGSVQEISRNNSTLQKDWTVIKSYNLPEELCIAVRGHKGWDKNKEAIPYAITVSIEILGADIPIYELIRVENQIEISV